MSRKKILLLIKLPPPVTGATLMNKMVRDSELLNDTFYISSIGISYSKSVAEMGSIRYGKLTAYFRYLIILAYKLYKTKYDLIYFQISPLGMAFIRDVLFVIIIKLTRTRIVYHLQGKGIMQKAQRSRFYDILYKYTFSNENVIIVSDLLKYDIENVHKGKIFIVPNAIPDIKNKPEIKNGYCPSIKLLFLSNLFISKGINVFISAIKILADRGIDINVKIVGADGDYNKKELELILKTNNLNKFAECLGAKYGEDKNLVFQDSDLLVYPTLEDVWGNVNLEAMQHGIPVIATREGAIPEIIDDGVTGFLVDKNDPLQLADKIEILYRNRELLRNMGKASRDKYVKYYISEIFEENLKRVFNLLTKER